MIFYISEWIAFIWAIMVTWKLFSTDAELRDFKKETKRTISSIADDVMRYNGLESKFVTMPNMLEIQKNMWDGIHKHTSAVRKLSEDTEKSISQTQEHLASLRESHIKLADMVSNKRPLLKFPSGAIQVEIYQPSKKLGKSKS